MAKRTYDYLADYYRAEAKAEPKASWAQVEKEIVGEWDAEKRDFNHNGILVRVGSREFLDTYKEHLRTLPPHHVIQSRIWEQSNGKIWEGETEARILNWRAFIREKIGKEKNAVFEAKEPWRSEFVFASQFMSDPFKLP